MYAHDHTHPATVGLGRYVAVPDSESRDDCPVEGVHVASLLKSHEDRSAHGEEEEDEWDHNAHCGCGYTGVFSLCALAA